MATGSYSTTSYNACSAISLMGLAISLYALYVEHNLDSKIDYRPMCDLAQYISCSKAFRSPFAKGLGVTSPLLGADHILTQRNPMYGCFSYMFMFLLQFIRSSWAKKLSQMLSILLNLLSIYLFFVLVYLRTICIVCVCIYVINALLLYFSFRKHTILGHNSINDSKKL